MTTPKHLTRSDDTPLPAPDSERGCISGVFQRSEPAEDVDGGELSPLVSRLGALEVEKHASVVRDLCVDVIRALEDQNGPGGLLEHLGTRAPWLWPRVDDLRREHDLIRTLAVTLDRYVRRHAPRAMTKVTLLRLTHALRRHHEAQLAIMQEAFLRDLGDAS